MGQSATTVAAILRPLSDEWDDLTELLEDLQAYTPEPLTSLYPVVQAIAEGESTQLRIYSDQAKEFVQHMREFAIEVELKD